MSIRDSAYMEDKLKRLKKIWRGFPDLRLGQIIGNCANYQQIYYLTDEELISMIEARYLAAAEKNLAEKKKKELMGGRNK